MNVYNEAHNLAKAIKECDELKQYLELKKQIDTNEDLSKAIADFQSKQMEYQLAQMSGKEPDDEMTNSIQELYGILMRDPKAAEYMQAEMSFSVMMNDVYKILGEAISN
ncbi:MAG: YlbF family regulator [Eubacteriales bacterium]|nr:YlbF family regulator [Eubacteriales bacterium]